MSMNDKEFQKLAKAIVCDYIESEIPLKNSVVKVAEQHDMNVHETRRLLETTNVRAHLSLFKEASDDKYVEFEVVDPDEVCGELFGRVSTPEESDCSEKVAAYVEVDHHLELPDEHFNGVQEEIEKVASEQVPIVEEPEKKPYDGEAGYQAISLVNKVASELKSRIHQKYMDYEDTLEKIASNYSSIYTDKSDLREFEKDAQALYGEDATHVVHSVFDRLNEQPDNVKIANHYVIEKPVHEKLASAVAQYRDLKDHINAFKDYKDQADPLIYE